MNTCLITGASGFFGRSLLHALRQANTGDQFICLYNSRRPPSSDDARFTWIKADLLNLSSHQEIMQRFKPTHCVHLAWHVPPQNFWHAEENLAWLRASAHLFQAFCETGGKVFMAAGSLAEYEWSTDVLEEEKTALAPRTLYGQCKKSLYEILKVIRDTQYKNTVLIWPRIGYFFGADEPSQKLISKIINSMKRGEKLNLTSKDTRRPYAHVKYLGSSLAHILFNQKEEDLTFNLSASKAYTLGEIVDFIDSELHLGQNHVSYGAYVSPAPEPITFEISTNVLKSNFGMDIPDTFFEDLRKTIEVNDVKI